MKQWMYGSAAALALALAGCGDDGNVQVNETAMNAPLTQIPAPQGDWTQMVQETPEGGYRMGNPDAPVKLVEYGSLGCHVCADFAADATEELRDTYVKSGQVSWEFRPFMLFPSDPGVTMLLRCMGPGPFFRLSDQLYADQENWMGRLREMPPEQAAQLEAMAPAERLGPLVRITGVDQFFRQRGMPEARINACLADPAALQRLMEITRQGNEEGVSGTPTFFINGRIQEQATAWRLLEPRLRAAIG